MKKISKFMVFFLSVLFFLSACQSSQAEIAPEYISDVNSSDLDGLEIKWGFSMSRYAEDTDNVFGFIPETAFADQVLEHQKKVESDLNCVITVDNNSNSSVIASKLNVELATGGHLYDLISADSSVLASLVRGNYLVGLSSYLDVQNTEKWGTPNQLQNMLWKDDLYGVLPNAWPYLLYTVPAGIIAVNEHLVSKIGATDPRDYVENKGWTWDKFEETLAARTYEDAGRTIYSINFHSDYFGINMFLSNGVNYTAVEDGKVICGIYTDAGRSALERGQRILNETCADYIYPDLTSNTSDFFYNEDCVMYLTGTGTLFSTADSLLYKMDNLGVLPFPQGPNAIPGKYHSYYQQIPYSTCIPITASDVEGTAKVLNAMFEPFEGYETKEDMLEYMTEQIFFDKRDSEVVFDIVSGAQYNFFWEGGRDLPANAVKSTETISQLFESNEDKYNALVEDYLEPQYEGRLAVYGE